MCDDGSRADDSMVADVNAFQNNRAAADPDGITNFHRLCYRQRAANAMLICIHDDDIPGNHAIPANMYLLLGDYLGIAVEKCSVANNNASALPDLQAHARKEVAILLNDNLSTFICDMRSGFATPGHNNAAARELPTQEPPPDIGRERRVFQTPMYRCYQRGRT